MPMRSTQKEESSQKQQETRQDLSCTVGADFVPVKAFEHDQSIRVSLVELMEGNFEHLPGRIERVFDNFRFVNQRARIVLVCPVNVNIGV